MSEQALTVVEENRGQVVNIEDYAMSVEGVVKQVNHIQMVMKAVMKKDEHYGVIPGCGDKPSLLKPGAEKLILAFRLDPQVEKEIISDMPGGHREYALTVVVYHAPTGMRLGTGVGSCTTMEGKYRFRPGPVEFTDKPVPKKYWDTRDKALLGGPGYVAKKQDGRWMIAKQGEKVDHDNPADYYNTCRKMAKKRAVVDAILTVTAASDIFTQDVEEMPEVIPGAKTAGPGKKPPTKPPQAKPETNGKTQVKIVLECPDGKGNISPDFCEEEKCLNLDGCGSYQGYLSRKK